MGVTYSIESAQKLAQQAAQHEHLDLNNGACLVSIQVSGSCGEATISKATAVVDGKQIHSGTVKGTKLEWFPSASLRFVGRLTQRAKRLLNDYGVAYNKNLALVPLSSLPKVVEKVNDLIEDFDKNIDGLLGRYDQIIELHKANNPNVAELIDHYKKDPANFRGSFSFFMSPPIAVSPLFEGDAPRIADEATSTLWKEVAEAARKIHKSMTVSSSSAIKGQQRERLTSKSINPLHTLLNKLEGLSFLDGSIDTVIDAFERALKSVPSDGVVEGENYHRMVNFVLAISNEEILRNHAEELAGGIYNFELTEVDTESTTERQTTELHSSDGIDDSTDWQGILSSEQQSGVQEMPPFGQFTF